MTEAPLKLDFVGPTAEDDMRRLFQRYGMAAAQAAYKRQTARKRGRPHEKDWQLLADIIREDAHDWLAGGNPFKTRSNAAIARKFAKDHPGQSCDSTVTRIRLKLSRSRRYVTLCEAERLAAKEYPYVEYLRALNAVMATGKYGELWTGQSYAALATISEYTRKYGEPSPKLTMQQIQADAAKPLTPKPMPENRNILQVMTGRPRQ